jgi:hypothetical protein
VGKKRMGEKTDRRRVVERQKTERSLVPLCLQSETKTEGERDNDRERKQAKDRERAKESESILVQQHHQI